jgi:hypothetical protein
MTETSRRPPTSPTTYRRRRITWLVAFILLLLCTLGLWKSTSAKPRLSRIWRNIKPSEDTSLVAVDEIYGLLHLVSGSETGQSKSLYGLDPRTPLDLSFYAPNEVIDWQKEVNHLRKHYPVVVFSKVVVENIF